MRIIQDTPTDQARHKNIQCDRHRDIGDTDVCGEANKEVGVGGSGGVEVVDTKRWNLLASSASDILYPHPKLPARGSKEK